MPYIIIVKTGNIGNRSILRRLSRKELYLLIVIRLLNGRITGMTRADFNGLCRRIFKKKLSAGEIKRALKKYEKLGLLPGMNRFWGGRDASFR